MSKVVKVMLENEFECSASELVQATKASKPETWLEPDEFAENTAEMLILASENTQPLQLEGPGFDSCKEFGDRRREQLTGFASRIKLLVSSESEIARAAERLIQASMMLQKFEILKDSPLISVWIEKHGLTVPPEFRTES